MRARNASSVHCDCSSQPLTAMAGTCVYAAEGKFPPEAVSQILLDGNRTAAGPTVPPGGLYMTKLWYDDGKAVFHVG